MPSENYMKIYGHFRYNPSGNGWPEYSDGYQYFMKYVARCWKVLSAVLCLMFLSHVLDIIIHAYSLIECVICTNVFLERPEFCHYTFDFWGPELVTFIQATRSMPLDVRAMFFSPDMKPSSNVCVSKRLSKQWSCRWFTIPSRSLWRHCNVNVK